MRINSIVKLTILVFITASSSYAQTFFDTIYYNEKWDTTSSNNASYYRITKQTGSIFEVVDYFIDDQIQMTGTYSAFNPDIRDGIFHYYSKSGLSSKQYYVNNLLEDTSYHYYDNGAIKYKKCYKHDKLVYLEGYYQTGELSRIEKYKREKLTRGKCYTKSGGDMLFYALYSDAKITVFKDIYAFLNKYIIYPPEAVKQKLEGRVIMQFIIERDGLISEIEILTSTNTIFNQAAIDAVKQSPRWIPAYMDGDPVRYRFTLPIKFSLK